MSSNCNSVSAFNICNSVSVSSMHLWHSRLGHTSDHVLKSLSSKLSISGSIECDNSSCTICPLSKMHRLPFHSNNKHCAFLFDLIHYDVWVLSTSQPLGESNIFSPLLMMQQGSLGSI